MKCEFSGVRAKPGGTVRDTHAQLTWRSSEFCVPAHSPVRPSASLRVRGSGGFRASSPDPASPPPVDTRSRAAHATPSIFTPASYNWERSICETALSRPKKQRKLNDRTPPPPPPHSLHSHGSRGAGPGPRARGIHSFTTARARGSGEVRGRGTPASLRRVRLEMMQLRGGRPGPPARASGPLAGRVLARRALTWTRTRESGAGRERPGAGAAGPTLLSRAANLELRGHRDLAADGARRRLAERRGRGPARGQSRVRSAPPAAARVPAPPSHLTPTPLPPPTPCPPAQPRVRHPAPTHTAGLHGPDPAPNSPPPLPRRRARTPPPPPPPTPRPHCTAAGPGPRPTAQAQGQDPTPPPQPPGPAPTGQAPGQDPAPRSRSPSPHHPPPQASNSPPPLHSRRAGTPPLPRPSVQPRALVAVSTPLSRVRRPGAPLPSSPPGSPDTAPPLPVPRTPHQHRRLQGCGHCVLGSVLRGDLLALRIRRAPSGAGEGLVLPRAWGSAEPRAPGPPTPALVPAASVRGAPSGNAAPGLWLPRGGVPGTDFCPPCCRCPAAPELALGACPPSPGAGKEPELAGSLA